VVEEAAAAAGVLMPTGWLTDEYVTTVNGCTIGRRFFFFLFLRNKRNKFSTSFKSWLHTTRFRRGVRTPEIEHASSYGSRRGQKPRVRTLRNAQAYHINRFGRGNI
jgi:hypothetical protein